MLREAESPALKEQRRREEEQCRREEAESRASEEQCRREEAESRALEEQRRREEAEEREKLSKLQTFQQFLLSCHSLNLAVRVETDLRLTTKGATTNPVGRFFPRQIIPWDGFAMKQVETWNELLVGEHFSSKPVFPSQHQFVAPLTGRNHE